MKLSRENKNSANVFEKRRGGSKQTKHYPHISESSRNSNAIDQKENQPLLLGQILNFNYEEG